MPDRVSPLAAVHTAAGAHFTDFAGWQMPLRYSSELAEHRAVRAAAGLFDLSHMGEIAVIGADAGAALDYALAGRLSTLAPGRATYTLLLAADGGIVDDLVVYRTGDDRFLVVANAANVAVVAEELRRRSDGFDVQVFDESADVALIAVQGPRALEIVCATEGFAIEGGHPDGEDVPAVLGALGYYRSVGGLFRERPLLIARTGYTGEDGFELFCAPDFAVELWEALAESGAPFGLVPAGLAARDSLRLEAGMPLYCHELTTGTMPAQAGLGRRVALDKDDFVGRAAVLRGPGENAPVLVGLSGQGRRAARDGYRVLDEAGVELGHVTSGELSPTLGHPIAMAYVDPAHTELGTTVFVDVRGATHPYTVTALPFYSRKKH